MLYHYYLKYTQRLSTIAEVQYVNNFTNPLYDPSINADENDGPNYNDISNIDENIYDTVVPFKNSDKTNSDDSSDEPQLILENPPYDAESEL